MLSIDTEKCKRDGICVAECPLGLIHMEDDGFPEMRKAAERLCILCGHCAAVCPHGALAIDGIRPEDCEPYPKSERVGLEAAAKLLKSRRSIRTYKDTPLTREDLDPVFDVVAYAPTAKNALPVHWTVWTDPAEVRRLAGLVAHWLTDGGHVPGAKKAFEAGGDPVLRGAPCLAVAHCGPEAMMPVVDCAIAATNLDLAAQAAGLGSCWAGYMVMAAANDPALAAELGLPEGHTPYAALMLGHPKYRYRSIPPRPEAAVDWR